MDKRKSKPSEYLSYTLIGILNVFALLPLSWLYVIGDFLRFFVYKVFRYRVDVVRVNLKNSFPHKSDEELRKIEQDFYRNFCDVMVEVIKFKTIRFDELKRRCYYTPETINELDDFFRNGKSIIIAMGHNGNWEWAGASYPLYNRHQVITAYRPLRNKVMDADTLKMRVRTGNIMIPMKSVMREMVRHKNEITATALIIDQKPPKENAFWIDFLNQETPFFKGSEVLSQKFNLPVFWGSVKRARRGKYIIDIRCLIENPGEYNDEGAITAILAARLEKDIIEQPELWLWSHRRWKDKRPDDGPVIPRVNPAHRTEN